MNSLDKRILKLEVKNALFGFDFRLCVRNGRVRQSLTFSLINHKKGVYFMEKLGISNLKPVVSLGIELGNVADKVGRNTGATRYLALMDLFDELTALGSVDFKAVGAEIKDLDAGEREELHNHLKAKFDIVDDKLEMAIEEGLKIVEEAYGLVTRSIALVKGMKEA